MRPVRCPRAFPLLLALLGIAGCSEDARRERDVKGMIQCIQQAREACVSEMTCTSYPDAFTVSDLLQVVDSLTDVDVNTLRLVGKDSRGDTVQYNYEVSGRKVAVTFCPEGFPGAISTLTVSE